MNADGREWKTGLLGFLGLKTWRPWRLGGENKRRFLNRESGESSESEKRTPDFTAFPLRLCGFARVTLKLASEMKVRVAWIFCAERGMLSGLANES